MLRPGGSTRQVTVQRHEGRGEEEGDVAERRDVVAVEEPMEVRVAWWSEGRQITLPVAVTMRTPGDDFELAAGFLLTEGVLAHRRQLAELTYCRGSGPDADPQQYNIVEARLREGETVDPDRFTRNFYTSSSCGVCGKASLEAVEVRGCAPLPEGGLRLDPALVSGLPDRVREAQRVFERTGGLHAAGLFGMPELAGEGDPLVREDVGRHNAVDKVVGRAFLDGRLPLADHVLVVSGRASFEIVQKAVAAGIPFLVAVGAPSSLAVDMARRFDVTLLAFARDGAFNAYAGEGRLKPGPGGSG